MDVCEFYDPFSFELIRQFAAFGFCKAHAVTYGRIAYRCAWLKAHHPAAFTSGSQKSTTRSLNPLRRAVRRVCLCFAAMPPEKAGYTGFPDISRDVTPYHISGISVRRGAPLKPIFKQ